MDEIKGPQPGPQTDFCSTSATLAITGGSFYGGKTFSLLMEAARNIDHPKYRGVIFRRTYTQITDAGGLADGAASLYPQYGGVPKKDRTLWEFPSGATIKFNHLQHDSDVLNYRSSQFCFLGFDQIEEFPMDAVFYLSTRNRPAPGYDRAAYRRATCNPEPGWLADMLEWYWDPDTGYPIKERSGVVRYFARIDGRIVWVDKDWRDGKIKPISFTFIPSLAVDNVIGMSLNPDYESNISTLDHVSVERYLKGNWKIGYSGGMFDTRWFKKVKYSELPIGMRLVRYWDFAASEVKPGTDPDWTSGCLMGEHNGDIYIINIDKFREAPGTTINKMKEHAEREGADVAIRWEEEKGSAGKFNSAHLSKVLLGYDAQPDQIVGDKVERAKPLSAAAQAGRVHIVDAPWNSEFLSEASSFPLKKKDQIDSCTGALKCLTMEKRVWPQYFQSMARPYVLDWNKASDYGIVYGAFHQTRQGELYILACLWDPAENILFVYDARHYENINTELTVIECAGMLHMTSKHKHTYLGNDTLVEEAPSKSTARVLDDTFKKYRIKSGIRKPTLYDEYGSVAYANNMFIARKINIHKSLNEVSAHVSGWAYDNDKLKPGFEYGRCLLLIMSEIKSVLRQQVEAKPDPDYAFKPSIRKEDLSSWETI